eukprot:gb/GECH01008107.1/.p1 GENE.gb/GECH01008107.1/~~gb/GECH01008107.1/.p1  ORF type:complete len:241 (+),score=55.36 gb/GECH01008107.1/:1-723(+)
MFSWFASNDLKQYRAGYPDQTDDNSINSNLQFYRNEISSSPQGEYIDEIHEKWYQNYELLENHHGYIQWLFPIRERGLNPHAYPLQKHEIEKMKQEEEIQDRITKSYCLMLDFYGIKMKNKRLHRSDNYKQRFRNLNRSPHNYLRITRILKCLGEFEFEKYQLEFLEFMFKEIFIEKTIPNAQRSFFNYWLPTVHRKDDKKMEQLKNEYEKQRKLPQKKRNQNTVVGSSEPQKKIQKKIN